MTVTLTGELPQEVYDVAVIGAGVVGTAIARELAQYPVRVAVLEACDDVGNGTSKANTAILHTGFDATPGTLESRLVRQGYQLLSAYAIEVGIPLERPGALLVAWDDDQLAALAALVGKAQRNGYPQLRVIGVEELRACEPHLGPEARGALDVPGESIICPWTTTLAFATQAVLGGVDLHLRCRAEKIITGGAVHQIVTSRGVVQARYLVNAAGLYSDEINRQLGHTEFTVRPRRGQLIVFDKLARGLIHHILLPVPTARGKGVLVAPTVYGTVILGPTAEDTDDKTATATSAEGLALLRHHGARIMPDLLDEEVTAVYAGLRAATEHDDYQIHCHADQRYVAVGGIRSTGLSASMAIATHATSLLAQAGLNLGIARELPPVRMPNIGEALPRPYQRSELIATDAEYGTLVCHCERVSRGEIRDALRSPIPPVSLGGLRRRTRALNGRCQGFYCAAAIRPLLDQHRTTTITHRTSSLTPAQRTVDVLVVGAGPAGLAAATALAAAGAGKVEILDRQQYAGGLTRIWRHTRDHHRYLDAMTHAGANLHTGVTATGWAGPRTLDTVSPAGRERITATAVVLATGARERPRNARWIPGDRPLGVLTTGQLQQAARSRQPMGRRAVIVGAEPVSYYALRTLRQAGVEVVAMVTELPRHQSHLTAHLAARWCHRVPLLTSVAVTGVIGHNRVEAVTLHRADGRTTMISCDTIVFTGDWIPDHELARSGAIPLDPGTQSPAVDTALRTCQPGGLRRRRPAAPRGDGHHRDPRRSSRCPISAAVPGRPALASLAPTRTRRQTAAVGHPQPHRPQRPPTPLLGPNI
jgi:glycerol-3-phosphate dehydrogenase